MSHDTTQETLVSKDTIEKGYECIKIFIAIRLNILKGLMKYKAGLALKRKIVFTLFSTINVCGERRGKIEKEKEVKHKHKMTSDILSIRVPQPLAGGHSLRTWTFQINLQKV